MRRVTILWNGGSIELEIDPSITRKLSADEKENDLEYPILGNYMWLRCNFLRVKVGELKGNEDMAVKITRRIRSGD